MQLLGKDSRLKRYEDVREMIGDAENPTPVVALRKLAPAGVDLYVKLEWMNPFGSVKDRPAKWMLDAMERRGELEGKAIVEATSGNTGIALAALARLMGKEMAATIPYNMPAEKLVFLRMLGADVTPTPLDAPAGEHPMDTAFRIAEEMVASGGYVMPNQYDNPDNRLAHEQTTGPEIWRQTEGRVRYFFAGFGTCGTLVGAGHYLKERHPDVKVVGIEPVPGHHISGLKNLEETNVPAILDRSVLDEVVMVDDDQTRDMLLRVWRDEALMVGSTSAAILAGAMRYLEGRKGVAVSIAPDSGQKAAAALLDALEE